MSYAEYTSRLNTDLLPESQPTKQEAHAKNEQQICEDGAQ